MACSPFFPGPADTLPTLRPYLGFLFESHVRFGHQYKTHPPRAQLLGRAP